MKHWDYGLVYGHLYNKTTISEIAKTLGIKKSTCLVSWDVIYVRGHFDHSEGHVHGVCCPPMPYAQFLQTPNNTTMEPCKKIVLFELIDIEGKFSLPVAAFNVPSSGTKQEILKYLNEIYEKWNGDIFKLIGSCADGEFTPCEVEQFMNSKISSGIWVHCEDYIHIVKRIRNPLIDNQCEISLTSLIYLSLRYDSIFLLLKKNDVVVQDEMKMQPVLNLISEELLVELRKIKQDLEKSISETVPSFSSIQSGYLLSSASDISSVLNDSCNYDTDSLLQNISEKKGKELEEYLCKAFNVAELSPSEELLVVSNLYDYLFHMQQFYQICHDNHYSITTKLNKMKDIIKYFDKSPLISEQTREGIASILRMWLHICNVVIDDGATLLSIVDLIDMIVNKKDEYDEMISQYIELEFHTSLISSNGLELIFSLLRHKIPNLSCFEFFKQLRKAIEVRNIFQLKEEVRGFSLPEFRISEHYNRMEIIMDKLLPQPDNKLKPLKYGKELRKNVEQTLKEMNWKLSSIPLRKDSNVVQKTNESIVCPVCAKIYSYDKCLKRHLREKHDMKDEEKCTLLFRCVVSTNYLTSALKQQVHRKERC